MGMLPKWRWGKGADGPKVFQIGFNKCGTRSMVRFFRQNRIPATHWSHGAVGHAFRYNLVTGRRPLEGFEEFVFYADMMGPFGEPIFEGHFYYKELHDAYPGALFILNTRNEDDWIASRMRHADFVGRFRHSYGLKGADEVETMWREMWHAHHEGVHRFFADKPGMLMNFDIDTQDGAALSAFLRPHYDTNPKHWGKVGAAPDKDADQAASSSAEAQA